MSRSETVLTPVQGLSAAMSAVQGLSASISNKINLKLQTKTVVPTDETQTIMADAGYAGLARVVVEAVPNTYGHISYDGATITIY